jgi:hypothetical protein
MTGLSYYMPLIYNKFSNSFHIRSHKNKYLFPYKKYLRLKF